MPNLTRSTIVARRIKAARTARGWSQDRLVEALAEHGYHITKNTLCTKETGRRPQISVDFLAAASHAFDIPVTTLLGLDDEHPTP